MSVESVSAWLSREYFNGKTIATFSQMVNGIEKMGGKVDTSSNIYDIIRLDGDSFVFHPEQYPQNSDSRQGVWELALLISVLVQKYGFGTAWGKWDCTQNTQYRTTNEDLMDVEELALATILPKQTFLEAVKNNTFGNVVNIRKISSGLDVNTSLIYARGKSLKIFK